MNTPNSPPPTVMPSAAPHPHRSVSLHSVFVYLGSSSHTGKLKAELVCVPPALVTQSPFSDPPPYPAHTPQADISQISVTPGPGAAGDSPKPRACWKYLT